MQRVLSTFGALALLAAITTVAGAQAEVSGIVTHVNPQSNVIHFIDGRPVYVEPGATFMVGGRLLSIDQVLPGMRVVVTGTRGQGGLPSIVTAAASHPLIDAIGTVAKFDPQSNTVTFQDGRMFTLGTQTTVWQQEQRAAIRSGERIFVRNAQPAGYRTAWNATTMPRHRMGTVVSVDPANALVILNDGTLVHVSPAARVQMEGQAMTLSQLRPGDEIVAIGSLRPVARRGDTGGMASPPTSRASTITTRQLPPYFSATFDASDIHLMRRVQAP